MKKIYVVLIILGVVLSSVGFYYFVPPLKYWTTSPTNFEECKEAGGRVWHTKNYFCVFRGQTFEEKAFKIGAVEVLDVQSPHPYPNSVNEKSVVWSDKVTHTGVKFLHLHFDRLEVNGKITVPTIFETVDYGPCEPGSEIKQQTEQKSGEEVSVGQLTPPKQCGLVQEKKIFTAQEILDEGYVTGDFVVLKDKAGNILDVLVEKPLADGWYRTYDTDTVTIDLYADNSENAYGIVIDKYSRGFSQAERETVNQQFSDQERERIIQQLAELYYKDCEKRGIPRNKCPIPK